MYPQLNFFVFTTSLLGLFTVNVGFNSSVMASVPCSDKGSINFHSNGSLESCIINNNVYVSEGSFTFLCKQGYIIRFDEKAHFKSCVISTPVNIRRGSTIENCPEKSKVTVSISKNGNQSVNCSRSYSRM